MNDPLLDIPRKLNPSFDDWKASYTDYAWKHDSAGIEEYSGRTLCIGIGGGEYEQKAHALASRGQLKRLGIDGRNVPQPLIDATGGILGLERLHLGNIGRRSLSSLSGLTELRSLCLEGIKGNQQLSILDLVSLEAVSISGDSDAILSLLREGNANVRYLALGGTTSANLQLPDLRILRRLPSIEYLVLLNVSVSSRSLEPCLALPSLRRVILNFARSWNRDSIATLRENGISVHCRMDEVRS